MAEPTGWVEPDPGYFSLVLHFDAGSGLWTQRSATPSPRASYGVATLDPSAVYLVGGGTTIQPSADGATARSAARATRSAARATRPAPARRAVGSAQWARSG